MPDFGGGGIGLHRYEGFSLEEKMAWTRQSAKYGMPGAVPAPEYALGDAVNLRIGTL